MNHLRPWAVTVALAMFAGGAAEAVEVLGTGTEALLGNDLTDFNDNGLEDVYNPPDNLGGFNATFFSSDEPGFGGGEFAFNVFDNDLSGGNGKWCCGTSFPQIVGADFGDEQYVLTSFTVSSANDVPARDPVLWSVEGSNDGEDWTTIFSHEDLEVAQDELFVLPGGPIWTDRFQVIRFDHGEDYDEQTEAYSMFRMVTEETGAVTGAFFQIGEIEFFDENAETPDEGPVVMPPPPPPPELDVGTILGSGTEFLLGDDLTDLDDDGDQFLYLPPDELGEFDAEFFSSDEEGFEGGEFAFNVFDNELTAGNGKWCCGTTFPQIVGADFRETHETQFRLTHFTVSSANDVPDRDPRVWSIEGSNDGECWTTIFSQDEPAAALWTERFQVILFEEGEDYEEQETAYSMFRMVTFGTGLTGGAFFQVGEIEFFGEEGEAPGDDAECACSGPVENLLCTKEDDGTIDMEWDVPAGCDGEIEILSGEEVIAVLEPGTTSHTIEPEDMVFVSTVSVSNGTPVPASCSLVEVLDGLLGDDLTDLDDDGDPLFYLPPDDLGEFDAEFFSSDEPGFEGGEFAFNVFDNVLGGGNEKWCCGTAFPQVVGADFTEFGEYRLTHFTVSSANDVPGRDPRVWRIEGSDDGEEWTPIFSQDDPNSAFWTERLQTIVFREGRDYPVQDTAYTMFRMVTELTGQVGGAFFQVGEIEFFGEEGPGEVEGASRKPGDVNGDGGFNIADMVAQLNFLFGGGGLPECYVIPNSDPVAVNPTGLAVLDYNGDNSSNIADAVAGLNGLFGGGDSHVLGEDCVKLEGSCESNCVQ